jgi:hypothetical protein
MIDVFAPVRHRFESSRLAQLDDVMTLVMWMRVSDLPTALWAVEKCIPNGCEALLDTQYGRATIFVDACELIPRGAGILEPSPLSDR